MKNMFFIHIPKTGGTSLRKSLQSFLGEEAIIRNYGIKSPETHPVIREQLDKPTYSYWLKEYTRGNELGVYAGHITLAPHRGVFPFSNIITIMREPTAQVTSHYNHFKRWYDYKGTFENFIKNKGFSNLQTKYLRSGIPANFIGLIGVTEEYNDSIDVINQYFGSSLTKQSQNVNVKKDILTPSTEQLALIRKYNQKDLDFYEFALKQFWERKKMSRLKVKWAYGGYHLSIKSRLINGAAYYDNDSSAVTILVKHEGKALTELSSTLYRPGLLAALPPRDGFIGFEYQIPEGVPLQKIQIEVKDTGQTLLPYYRPS